MTVNTNFATKESKIRRCVLTVLDSWHIRNMGWWYGHPALVDEVNEIISERVTMKETTTMLRTLRKEGLVTTMPLFDESTGKLKGSGYFISLEGRKAIREINVHLGV